MDCEYQAGGLEGKRSSGLGGYLRKFRTSLNAPSTDKTSTGNVSDSTPRSSRPTVRSSTGALPVRNKSARAQADTNRNSAPVAIREKNDSEANNTLLRSKSSTGFEDRKPGVPRPLSGGVFQQEHIHPSKRSYSADRLEAFARITIQYYCHVCDSRFGPGRDCPSCSHQYCQECLRRPEQDIALPPTTTQTFSTTSSSVAGTKRRASPYSSFELPRTAAPLVRKIYRSCHRCATPFPSSERICAECNHLQCSKCPRRPISSTQDPRMSLQNRDSHTNTQTYAHTPENGGKVRERTRKVPRQRIRWTCERCGSLFRERNRRCDGCGHLRCDECQRDP